MTPTTSQNNQNFDHPFKTSAQRLEEKKKEKAAAEEKERQRIKALQEAFKDQKMAYINLVATLRQQPVGLRIALLQSNPKILQKFSRKERKRLLAVAHEGLTRKQLRKVHFPVRPKTIRARAKVA